jgi:hypothetical protein
MDTVDREHLETNLSSTMTRQLEEFRKERAAWEQQKAEEEAEKREQEAKAMREKYEKLIEIQTQEAEERSESRKLRNKLLGAVIAILTAAGGTGGYFAVQPEPQRVETKEVQETVVSKTGAIESRVGKLEGKMERVGSAQVDSQIQQAEGVAYIVDKIDTAHPRSADKVDEPKVVEEARIRSTEIQKKKRRAEVLGEKYDAFEDLPKP